MIKIIKYSFIEMQRSVMYHNIQNLKELQDI